MTSTKRGLVKPVTGIPTILSDYWISNDNTETGPWDPNPPPLIIESQDSTYVDMSSIKRKVTLCNYMYICESAGPKHLLFPVIGLWLGMLCYDMISNNFMLLFNVNNSNEFFCFDIVITLILEQQRNCNLIGLLKDSIL